MTTNTNNNYANLRRLIVTVKALVTLLTWLRYVKNATMFTTKHISAPTTAPIPPTSPTRPVGLSANPPGVDCRGRLVPQTGHAYQTCQHRALIAPLLASPCLMRAATALISAANPAAVAANATCAEGSWQMLSEIEGC